MHKVVIIAAAIAAAFLTGYALLLTGPYNPFSDKEALAKKITQGGVLYNATCAKCHGRNLEGQPNWKMPLPNGRLPAPPHDRSGHTWHHTDSALASITKLGLKPFAGDNYQSDMPAFGAVLSDEEIEAILDYIKSTWPERERAYQRQVTQQAN
ncbi:MAG: cytochrome c [Aestuariivirga sp.]